MVENANTLHGNEIHRVDSPSNEVSKTAMFSIILGEGWLESLGKMAKNREIDCHAN